jgi:plastocyanin
MGMKKLLALLAVVALATFGLAACGGDDDDDGGDETAAEVTTTEEATSGGGGGAGGTLDISSPASGDLAYDQTELTTAAGSVTVNYTNPAEISHDVAIEDESGQEIGKTDLISGGDESSAAVDLQPGRYTFFCTVPGHRDAGMEGTITVE